MATPDLFDAPAYRKLGRVGGYSSDLVKSGKDVYIRRGGEIKYAGEAKNYKGPEGKKRLAKLREKERAGIFQKLTDQHGRSGDSVRGAVATVRSIGKVPVDKATAQEAKRIILKAKKGRESYLAGRKEVASVNVPGHISGGVYQHKGRFIGEERDLVRSMSTRTAFDTKRDALSELKNLKKTAVEVGAKDAARAIVAKGTDAASRESFAQRLAKLRATQGPLAVAREIAKARKELAKERGIKRTTKSGSTVKANPGYSTKPQAVGAAAAVVARAEKGQNVGQDALQRARAFLASKGIDPSGKSAKRKPGRGLR